MKFNLPSLALGKTKIVGGEKMIDYTTYEEAMAKLHEIHNIIDRAPKYKNKHKVHNMLSNIRAFLIAELEETFDPGARQEEDS